MVPLDRLAEMVAAVPRIGQRHGLTGLSFGHAGDGNLHSSFLLDPADPAQFAAAQAAVQELFDLTLEMDGSISGEHGLGIGQGRLPGAAVGPGRRRRTPRDQAGARPEGAVQPGQEAVR